MTGSVTNWIRLLQAGDEAGAEPLFRRYFDRLVQLCRAHLSGRPPRLADGEDVAQQTLASFFQHAAAKRYPDLQDRNELWRLLLSIAGNKAKSLLKREGRKKRGGGLVAEESRLAGGKSVEGWNLDWEIGDQPTPEMVVSLAETLEQLERRLPDGELRKIAELKLAGYLNSEIATQIGCALATVERRLRLIRSILQDSDGEEDAP